MKFSFFRQVKPPVGEVVDSFDISETTIGTHKSHVDVLVVEFGEFVLLRAGTFALTVAKDPCAIFVEVASQFLLVSVLAG
jgi:hypothetical protein